MALMKCDKIIQLPNQHTVHGLRVQKYPRTGYVFCNGEDGVPLPNDGKVLNSPKDYYSIFTAVDGDTMKDDVVTVRHRDTMLQERVKVRELTTWLANAVRCWKRPERKAPTAASS